MSESNKSKPKTSKSQVEEALEGTVESEAKPKSTKPKRESTKSKRKAQDLKRNWRAHQEAIIRIAAVFTNKQDIDWATTGRRIYEKGANQYPYLIKNNEQPNEGLPYWGVGDWVAAWERVRKDVAHGSNRLPRPYELFNILRLLIELTPEEKRKLGLGALPYLPLLERAAINVLREPDPQKAQARAEALYRVSIEINSNYNQHFSESYDDAIKLIEKRSEKMIKTYLGKKRDWGEEIQNLTARSKQELDRILVENGVQAISGRDIYIKEYLSLDQLEQIPLVIDAKDRITEVLPIYLEAYDIERCGPLPLKVGHCPSSDRALLSETLLKLRSTDKPDEELSQLIDSSLDLQFSFHMRLDFRLGSMDDSEKPMLFSIRGRGVGGHLSLAHRLINQFLLADIPCLQEYFPVAKDRFMHQDVVGQRTASIIRSHAVVQLCRRTSLAEAIRDDSSYDDYSEFDPIGQADYIGFSLPLTVMRAKNLATLDAIRSTLVEPKKYYEDLKNKVEYVWQLEYARSLLNGYPFSLLAADSFLNTGKRILEKYAPDIVRHNKTISDLRNKEQPNKQLTDAISKALKEIPVVYFDAVLTLAEGFLAEGLYRKAFDYINKIEPILGTLTQQMISQQQIKTQQEGNSSKNLDIFSGAILTRYELAFAHYYLIADCDEERNLPEEEKKVPLDRQSCISKAWKGLDNAESHLALRQKKYLLIREPSQSSFSPYYDLKSQICLKRAMLLLLCPRCLSVDEREKYVPEQVISGTELDDKPLVFFHFSVLHWLEKARLYAAMNTNLEQYIRCTAYQCFVFIMTSFTLKIKAPQTQGKNEKNRIDKDWAWSWANELRLDALRSFAPIGQKQYYQLKEKSGVDPSSDSYKIGDIKVEYLPNIYEYRSKNNQEKPENKEEDLCIDLFYMHVRMDKTDIGIPRSMNKVPHSTKEGIYLFGPTACYLFFIRGVYHLCSQERYEFPDEVKQGTINSLDGWRAKLEEAYLLFTHAWSMADDLCPLDEIDENKVIGRKINFKEEHKIDSKEEHTFDRVAKSVGVLIPLRVTEIATLAKVFAAACLLLKQYARTTDEVDTQWDKDRKFLLDAEQLYSKFNLKGKMCDISQSQNRYNGFLEPYLEKVLTPLNPPVLPERLKEDAWRELTKRRDELVQQLFQAFCGSLSP